ncbi:MAG: trigger factor [Pseudomonadota bacterium]
MQHHHHDDLNLKKIDKLSPTRVRLTVEYDAGAITRHEASVVNRYTQAAKIPGFRPGKAPVSLIKQKFKEEILRDIVSHLLEAGLSEAIQKAKLSPVSQPQVKVGEVKEGQPFGFEAEFDVQPDIELKNYKNIPLTRKPAEVSQEEVDKTLQNLRDRLSTLEPDTATKPEKGSFAVVEVSFELENSDTKQEKQTHTVELGADRLLPNIEKEILTMTVGETKLIEDVFPADYPEKELAGKKAKFDLKVLELKRKVLPELNDEFAKQLKEGSSLEAIKQEILDNIKASKEAEARRDERQTLVDYLIENNRFDVAQSFVQSQSAQLVQWMEEDWKKRGMKMPALKPEDTKQVQERAERMVRSSLLLREIAVKESISLDPEKLKQRVELISTQLGRSIEETEKLLAGRDMLDKIKDEILTDQVFEFLLSQAKIRN